MNFLLDTHVLLWWLENNPTLSQNTREIIRNPENQGYISAASIWEIQIKQLVGKITIPEDFFERLLGEPFKTLDITVMHANALANLQPYHRDPFDWMLIIQAQVEDLTLVTRDRDIQKYDVQTLKA